MASKTPTKRATKAKRRKLHEQAAVRRVTTSSSPPTSSGHSVAIDRDTLSRILSAAKSGTPASAKDLRAIEQALGVHETSRKKRGRKSLLELYLHDDRIQRYIDIANRVMTYMANGECKSENAAFTRVGNELHASLSMVRRTWAAYGDIVKDAHKLDQMIVQRLIEIEGLAQIDRVGHDHRRTSFNLVLLDQLMGRSKKA